MSPPRLFRRIALWVLLPLAALPASGQTGGGFAGKARVVAVDVVVELMKKETLLTRRHEPQTKIATRDLKVRLEGKAMDVVGVEAPGPEAEPWRVLIYIDTHLRGDQELRWGASLLAEQVETLASLGEVEIVVADPQPRTMLAPTRDTEAMAQALSSWALEGVGDNALTNLRDAVLEAAEGEDLDPRDLVALETALIQERLDTLLLRLVEGLPTTPRRAVVPIGLGFDLRPESFYLPSEEGHPDSPGPGPGDLERATADLARTLAGYGWVALPLAAPLPENRAKLKPGIRIGKFRLQWGNDLNLPGFSATYEGNRDPEKADAHYEVGRQLALAEKHEEAAESFHQAIYRYYGDPRTADRQIRAYEALAEVYRKMGEAEAALRVQEAARELEEVAARRQAKKTGPSNPGTGDETRPALEASEDLAGEDDSRPVGAADIDPQATFEGLAGATAGQAVRGKKDLEEALASLARRYRLTYQWEGAAAGIPRALTVSPRDDAFEVRAPSHGHLGIPEALAATRVRRIFTSELPNEAGDLEAQEAQEERAGSPGMVRIAIDLRGQGQEGDSLRLTYGLGGFDESVEVRHVPVPRQALKEQTFYLEVPLDEDRPGLALVLDNLTTRTWAATILDL